LTNEERRQVLDAGREAVTDTVGAVWGGAKDGAEEVGDFVDDIF
jgi:hypothetical protein